MRWGLYALIIGGVHSISPYTIEDGSTFYLEAARELTWPDCPYRFLSFPSSCDNVDLWNNAGINQEWTLRDIGNGNFVMQASCGYFFSYSSDCNNHGVGLSATEDATIQSLTFVVGDNTQFEYYVYAAGREHCDYQWLSFPVPCTTSTPDVVDLWHAAGPDQRFRLHPVRTNVPIPNEPISNSACADPYVWYSASSDSYALQCTGGGLPLSFSSGDMGSTASFSLAGDSLGGTPAPWASVPGQRWAPENFEDGEENYVFFSCASDDTGNVHRVGYSLSTTGAKPGAWDQYSSSYLDLGNTAGGEIDQTVFVDDDGKQYLLWKSDDNNVGMSTTRIWMQEVMIANASVTMIESSLVVLDSSGMWWVDSWVDGGSLVEGPEMIKANGYYYLFFAGGKYCQSSYSEGVARSSNIWGPYQKMSVPFLSSGIVGQSATNHNANLIGPGHGSLVRDPATDEMYMVFHANLDDQCNRLPFQAAVKFGFDNWPYADF